MEIGLCIPGKPRGKGRPRFTRSGHAFTPKETRDYENLIKQKYKEFYDGYMFPADIPLRLTIEAYYPIPKADKKSIHDLKSDNQILPVNIKPDIDNVVKIISDALNGIAFHDDTQIVRLSAWKRYSDVPRVEIFLEEYKP